MEDVELDVGPLTRFGLGQVEGTEKDFLGRECGVSKE